MDERETIPVERVRSRFLTALILLGAALAGADEFKVHLLSPWLGDPARADKVPHIISNEMGPGHPGAPMTATGEGWYEYTWTTAKTPEPHVTFFFQSYIPNPNYAYDQAQQYINGTQNFRFGDTFLAWDVNEIWIIPQGPGKPPLITDIPQVKKVAYLYNPWPVSAPQSRTAPIADWSTMRQSRDPARCGWYLHHFTGAERTLSFKSLIGNQTYGSTGLGGAQAIDLAAAFATSDTVYLAPDPLPGGPPRILTRFPEGMVGTCGFPLAVTVRDFSKNHPDFEKGQAMGDAVVKNMVMPTLGPDKKPLKGPNPHTFQSRFEDWFRTQSTQTNPDWNNHETCKDLTLSKDAKGYWAYDSYLEKGHGYFPIDDFNRFNQTFASNYLERGTNQWKNANEVHNFHFCMELHAQFEYRPGQVFKFSGDDDVWVYINDKMVIDLGGAHQAATDTVNLDKLGLTEGTRYDFDMFFCERQTTSSNLLMQTSIYFEQEQSVFAKKTPLPGDKSQYDIFEILSGDKSCGANKGGDTVIANSLFKLSGPSVNPAEVLPPGLSHGGITINPAKTQVTVDTAKITGLRPGVYTVTFTSERSGKGGYIQFTVSVPFIPAVVKAACFADKDGDGRIETVAIRFDKELPAAPDKLAFALRDQRGLNESRDAASREIAQSGAVTTVTLANPFPFGMTSVTNAPTAGTLFDQPALGLLAGTFAIEDSVAPVILKAETREPDSTMPNKQVLFEVSENVDLPLTSPTALVFKREAAELPPMSIRLLPTVRTGERTFAAVVDTTSEVFPIVGDSLALSDGGEVKDAPGNAPGRKLFVRIGGLVPKAKPMEIYVTFPNGSREKATAGIFPHGRNSFIPVDSRGFPLPGIPRDGKCPGCPAMEGNILAGPVFHIVTAGPMDYTLRIFTNTGGFVATGQGRIGEADLPLLQKRNDASGVRYIARVVWTGTTANGGQAGTGAYVLVASMTLPKDLKTGVGPGNQSGKIRFGMLRGL